MKGVIIITSKVTNSGQANLLLQSVESAKQQHPDFSIVILNDNSNVNFWPGNILDVTVELIEKPYIGCGEINAYVWSSKHASEYDIFIFIHDSVCIKQSLPLTFPDNINFMPLWNTNGKCVKDSTNPTKVLDEFMEKFKPNMNDEMTLIRSGKGDVIFGCMGLWNTKFAEFLASSNLAEVAPILNTRPLRCFFERFSYCIVKSQQSVENLASYSIAKNIFSHHQSFKNTSFNISNSGNPYLVKVWQGR
jgi:hypothetical protein